MSGVTPDFRPVDIHVCKRLDFSLVSVYLGGIGGGCLQQMSLFSQFNTVSRLSLSETCSSSWSWSPEGGGSPLGGDSSSRAAWWSWRLGGLVTCLMENPFLSNIAYEYEYEYESQHAINYLHCLTVDGESLATTLDVDEVTPLVTMEASLRDGMGTAESTSAFLSQKEH